MEKEGDIGRVKVWKVFRAAWSSRGRQLLQVKTHIPCPIETYHCRATGGATQAQLQNAYKVGRKLEKYKSVSSDVKYGTAHLGLVNSVYVRII